MLPRVGDTAYTLRHAKMEAKLDAALASKDKEVNGLKRKLEELEKKQGEMSKQANVLRNGACGRSTSLGNPKKRCVPSGIPLS